MSIKLSPLRGMKDLLPDEFRVHKYITDTAYSAAELYGYEGFATPLLESINVFDRTLGETSDVISKEMYSFESKGGDLIALRPEFTAGIVRAFFSNGLKQKLPLKLFSSGPVFRYDRPQKGRQRQFHQLNLEYIGANGAYSDAETILLASHVLEKLDILKDVTLELNSLGCNESRENYQKALVDYFQNHIDELSEDSKRRLTKNPLRILDSKDESDKKIAQNAPFISDYYTKEAALYFDEVKRYLDQLGVSYVVNPRLARGLDYYSHTAFEFVTDKLGAQGTVLAGGRYDGLTKLMGQSEVPSIGFAAGIERIALLREFSPKKGRPAVIIPIGKEGIEHAINLANIMRKSDILTRLELSGKASKHMQTALSINAKSVIFIGSDEVASNSYKLKDLDKKVEKNMNLKEMLSFFGK